MSYVAFISYKHSSNDLAHAEALETALKRYAKPLWKPPISIFRDERVFKPGDDLPAVIRTALTESEFLLYLASEQSASSEWVRDELRIWCDELQRANRLIIVHVGGSITVDPAKRTLVWSETDALPSLLEPHVQSIPIWANLAWANALEQRNLQNERYAKQINAIVARFRGKTPGDMNDAEVLVHRRNIILRNAGMVVIGLCVLLASVFGFAEHQQRRVAEQRARNIDIADAFRQLDRGNDYLRDSAIEEASHQFADVMARLRDIGLDPVLALHCSFAANSQRFDVTEIANVRGEADYMLVSSDGDHIAVVFDYETPAGDNSSEDIPDWPAVAVFQQSTKQCILEQPIASAIGHRVYQKRIGAVGLMAPYDLILETRDGAYARLSLLDGTEEPCDPNICAKYLSLHTRGDLPESLQHVLSDDELANDPEDGTTMGYGPFLRKYVLELAPDRRTAVLGSYTGNLRVLDLRTRSIRLQEGKYGPFYAGAYRADGQRAYLCSNHELYEVDTSLPQGVIEFDAALQVDPENAFRSERVLSIAFSDDGSRLAVATTRRLMCLNVVGRSWREWRLPREIDSAAALRVTSDNALVDLVSGEDGTLYTGGVDSISLLTAPSPTGGKPVAAWIEKDQAWLAETMLVDGAARVQSVALPGRTATPTAFAVPLGDEAGTHDFRSLVGVHAIAHLGEELVLFHGDANPTRDYEMRNEQMTVIALRNREQTHSVVVFKATSMTDPLGEEHWSAETVDVLLPTSRSDRLLAKGSHGIDSISSDGTHERAIGDLITTDYRDREQTYSFGVDNDADNLYFAAIHHESGTSVRTKLPWGFDRKPEFAAISSNGRRIAVADCRGDILLLDVSVLGVKASTR